MQMGEILWDASQHRHHIRKNNMRCPFSKFAPSLHLCCIMSYTFLSEQTLFKSSFHVILKTNVKNSPIVLETLHFPAVHRRHEDQTQTWRVLTHCARSFSLPLFHSFISAFARQSSYIWLRRQWWTHEDALFLSLGRNGAVLRFDSELRASRSTRQPRLITSECLLSFLHADSHSFSSPSRAVILRCFDTLTHHTSISLASALLSIDTGGLEFYSACLNSGFVEKPRCKHKT